MTQYHFIEKFLHLASPISLDKNTYIKKKNMDFLYLTYMKRGPSSCTLFVTG